MSAHPRYRFRFVWPNGHRSTNTMLQKLGAEFDRHSGQDVCQSLDRIYGGPFTCRVSASAVDAKHDAGDAGRLKNLAIGPEWLAALCRFLSKLVAGNSIHQGHDRFRCRDFERWT